MYNVVYFFFFFFGEVDGGWVGGCRFCRNTSLFARVQRIWPVVVV